MQTGKQMRWIAEHRPVEGEMEGVDGVAGGRFRQPRGARLHEASPQQTVETVVHPLSGPCDTATSWVREGRAVHGWQPVQGNE